MPRLTLALVLPLALACTQTGRPGANEPLIREEAERPPPAAAPPQAPPAEPARPAPLRRTGSMTRSELLSVLDVSPGAFLQHVETEPRLSSGRFTGWRIKSFFPGDPRFSQVDLHAGDVVLRVNGRGLERPEHLMAVWQALRGAYELVVEVERDGAPHTLRWTISGAPR